MSSRNDSITKLARLVQDVFRLKQLTQQSIEDDERSRKENIQTNYLFDPDVLELYVQPDRWSKLVAALPSLHEADTDESPDADEEEKTNIPVSALQPGESFKNNSVLE